MALAPELRVSDEVARDGKHAFTDLERALTVGDAYVVCWHSSVGCDCRAVVMRLVGPVLQVIQGDVDEALRLMSMSKISLEDEELQEQVVKDPVREAFSKVCRCLVHDECSQLSSAPHTNSPAVQTLP